MADSPPFIVYVIIGVVILLALAIWCLLGGWRRERRFHRRWRRATLGGWLVPWVPKVGESNVEPNNPIFREVWLDKPDKVGVKDIRTIKPITAATTPTHPSSRTAIVSYPPPPPPTRVQKIRESLLVPSTDPKIPSVLDERPRPKTIHLGMIPATVQAGVVILMPGGTGDKAGNTGGDEEMRKYIVRGPEICIGHLVVERKESRWIIEGRFV